MSTGISISSINRIKELAEEKKFAEALEILDTQNLDKSINPQFLRISGEIFRENKRYYDSRRILMKAHQMSPQGNRIIYELIQLYLELGYFAKAEKYYEQYLFNSGAEDTQKDYVEYIMKKAKGAEIKELASILLPILERMPEDKWNFEAVLLYDKMDRKDKALDESRYILENFKESIFVQPVIEYIDDKLDVDKWFYVYPHEEQEEDTELFGNLIEEEEKLLEADHLRMYPPEARIMVEAEDKDALEQRPVKDKKTKKKKKKDADDSADSSISDLDEYEEPEDRSVQDIIREAEMLINPDYKPEDIAEKTEDSARKQTEDILQEEIKIKEEREAALEKLLSKKIDKDKIKESAKQVAQAVKEIDTTKAKNQVKSVADSVMDNVKKATDAIGEAVGTKQTGEEQISNIGENTSEEIMDGIIESVLEPPKKTVGQVIMNEELDAMIPDSLEAMSKEEIADIEARKEEEERLELEALEASLELAEKKKAKSKRKKSDAETQEADENETEDNQIVQGGISGEQLSYTGESYTELKEKFLAEMQAEEEQPLDSLGFITVVHSDVDETMEEAMPDAAGMLRQMIDNKEFYTGEDSRGFESKVSYDNHGFEVEDFDFEEYRESDIEDENIDKTDGMHDSQIPLTVEVIYAQEQVVDFDEIVPDEPIVRAEKPAPIEQMATEPEARWEVPVDSEVRWEAPDEPEAKQETSVEPEVKWEEPVEPIAEETTAETEVEIEEAAPIEQMAAEPEARWEVPVDSEVRWEAPDEPEAKQEASVEPEVKWEEPDEPIAEEATAETEVEIEEPAPIEQMVVEPEVRWEAPDEPEAKQEASVEPEVKWEEPIVEETTAETEVEIEKPAPIEQMVVEPEVRWEEPDEPEAKQEASVEPEVKWEEPDEPIAEETTAETEVEIEESAPIEQMVVEPEARWEVPVDSEVRWEAPDEPEAKQEASVEPEVRWEEPDEPITEETTAETEVEIEEAAPIEQMEAEPEARWEEPDEPIAEETTAETEVEIEEPAPIEQMTAEPEMGVEEQKQIVTRDDLRVRILISESMVKKLLELKESR